MDVDRGRVGFPLMVDGHPKYPGVLLLERVDGSDASVRFIRVVFGEEFAPFQVVVFSAGQVYDIIHGVIL